MSTVRRHLLPPQTTALERAVDQTFPAWDELADAGAPMAVHGNASFLPWIAAQWQVAQFAALFPSTEALLAAALPWLFQRGTAASVRRALGWIGFDQVTLEEDGPYLHIDVGRELREIEFAVVTQVVLSSLPLHVRFYRIFHGLDQRPVRLDHGPTLDDGLLDDDSGAWYSVEDHPLKVSQGNVRRALAGPLAVAGIRTAQIQRRLTVLTYTDRLILDAWALDSELLADASGGFTALRSVISSPYILMQALSNHAVAFTTFARWPAPAEILATTQTAHTSAVRPHPRGRRWSGRWAGPWRSHFQTRLSEES